jgi:hypothetical protein
MQERNNARKKEKSRAAGERERPPSGEGFSISSQRLKPILAEA